MECVKDMGLTRSSTIKLPRESRKRLGKQNEGFQFIKSFEECVEVASGRVTPVTGMLGAWA